MVESILFHVLPKTDDPPKSARNAVYLRTDYWDDWGKFRTQFYLTVCDDKGTAHRIGEVKIGQIGLKRHGGARKIPPGHRTPSLPITPFTALDETFFSLGQEDSYYENLARLGGTWRECVLKALRDVAFDQTIWAKTKTEDVMEESLLRDVSVSRVEGQLRRMALGGARLTPYRFSFRAICAICVLMS